MINLEKLEDLPAHMGLRKSTQADLLKREVQSETRPDFNTVIRRHKGLKPWQKCPREGSYVCDE